MEVGARPLTVGVTFGLPLVSFPVPILPVAVGSAKVVSSGSIVWSNGAVALIVAASVILVLPVHAELTLHTQVAWLVTWSA